MNSNHIFSYKDSGVDIDGAEEFVGYIKQKLAATSHRGVISKIGGFASLFDLSDAIKGIAEPVILSSTDGVGTKLLVAQALGKHDTIGQDLVAMCVNDILVQGGRPLFFLDYIAMGKLNHDILQKIIDGIVIGCNLGKVSLVGGETAEMPDMYSDNKYDLAGFVVGIADKSNLRPDIPSIKEGDALVGIASNGFHSNGYSLLRKLKIDYSTKCGNLTFGELLMKPTFIYTDSILNILPHVKGMAHITGGGLYGNVPRIIPDGLCAEIDLSSWPLIDEFSIVRDRGVSEQEMLKTFNTGLGIVCITDCPDKVINILHDVGNDCYVIGRMISDVKNKVAFVNHLN